MDIVCSFYYSENNERQKELELTLTNNMGKSFINRIHLIITCQDKDKLLNSEFTNHENFSKLLLHDKEEQPTYEYLINYISTIEGHIVAICNSDIEFGINENDYSILNNLKNKKLGYFLSRHEHDLTKPQIDRYWGSHDAFIFHSDQIKKDIVGKDLSYLNYVQNTSGIEALLIVFFIETMKYELKNPCYQIVLKHHHKSNVRLWVKKNHKIVGYSNPRPVPGKSGVHCRYMIEPCKL